MRGIGKAAAILPAGAVALVLVSLAAAAPGTKPITVKGTQTIVDEPKGKYSMHGSLVGAWNVTGFTLHYAEADGNVVASGREVFKGCHDTDRNGLCDAGEPAGTLRFTFVYWAAFKPGTETLVRGQCVHPVVGGTGAFAKAKGVIHMIDRPVRGGVRTTYSGTLLVPGIAAAATTPSLEPREASRTLAARVAGGCGG